MFNLNTQIVIASFVEKTILSPYLWVKKPVSIYVWVPFWALCPFHFISFVNTWCECLTVSPWGGPCLQSVSGVSTLTVADFRPLLSFLLLFPTPLSFPFSLSLLLSFFLLALFSYSLPLPFSRICIPHREDPNVCLSHCLEMPDTQ